MHAPMITLTGVFGREALSLYKTAKGFSSILGNTSSAKTFAQEFSNAFCSRAVSFKKLSNRDNCSTSFVLKDICKPPLFDKMIIPYVFHQ